MEQCALYGLDVVVTSTTSKPHYQAHEVRILMQRDVLFSRLYAQHPTEQWAATLEDGA